MNMNQVEKAELRARFEGVVIEFLLPESERELLAKGASRNNIVKTFSNVRPNTNIFDMLNALVRVVEDFEPIDYTSEAPDYDPA